MLIDLDNRTSLLLGVIPPSEVESHQRVVTEHGYKLPTHKFHRAPSTINELAKYQKETVVSMTNGTLLLFEFRNIFEPRLSLPIVTYSKYFLMYFLFDGGTKVPLQIFGDADEQILETAVYFASLRVSGDKKLGHQILIRFHDSVSFTSSHEGQLSLLFDSLSTRNISFFHSRLSSILSAVITSRPYRLKLTLCSSSSVDYDAFLENLQGRRTSFGSLSLVYKEGEDAYIRRLFHHFRLFKRIHFSGLPPDLLLKLLSAPTKSISFGIERVSRTMDLTDAKIVPKDISFAASMNDISTAFITSFLHRVAQLGHLEKLHFMGLDPVPTDVARALVCAVGASKNLRRLTVSDGSSNEYSCFLKDLFAALENLCSLRTLVIDKYPEELDPFFRWLKRLLRRNRNIDVFTSVPSVHMKDDRQLNEIKAVTRFFRGLPRLTGVPLLTRQSLLGAALTRNAEGDVERAGILLNDHVDLLLKLLQDA
jgi:hypothetical protein